MGNNKNIFEGAKFPDLFVRRDGKLAVYMGLVCRPSDKEDSYNHRLISEEWNVVKTYNDFGYNFRTTPQDIDIVAKYNPNKI